MKKVMLHVVLFTLVVLMAGALTLVVADELPPEYAEQIPEDMKARIKYLGGQSMFRAAEAFNMKEIMGKSTDEPSDVSGLLPEFTSNVGIGVNSTKHENEPTVVVNPQNSMNLVAGSHFFGPPSPFTNRCVVYHSFDGGATWSDPIPMPHLNPASSCSDPVLAFAPDGSRVYYSYMDIKQIFDPIPPFTLTIDFDIVVGYSDDGGVTWTPDPVVALDGLPTVVTFFPFSITPGFSYDKNWIGTHVPDDDNDNGNSNWVYVTATRFDDIAPGNCHIAFTRSNRMGVGSSWSLPILLDSSVGGCGNRVVQGSRPTGGLGNDVLIAWFNSSTDGWLTGSFEIKTAYSSNKGATFGSPVTAVVDSDETPFWLGPFSFYHRWWGSMYPDVEIAPDGTAHIVYTHDPEAGSSNEEDGDIRYIKSRRAPYNSWSTPVTLNDDGLVRAQGYAALETSQGDDDDDVSLHVIWEDHRLSSTVPIRFPFSSNLFFDMFYTTKDDDDNGWWSPNIRITDASSINDWIFIGDYNDITVAGEDDEDSLIFGIWTDRRHQTSIFAFEDNVFGDIIYNPFEDD